MKDGQLTEIYLPRIVVAYLSPRRTMNQRAIYLGYDAVGGVGGRITIQSYHAQCA